MSQSLLSWWHSWFDLSAIFVYNPLNTLIKVKGKGISCCCSFFYEDGNRDFICQQLKAWRADLMVRMTIFISLRLFIHVAFPNSVIWGLSHYASNLFPGHWDSWRADSELCFLLNCTLCNAPSVPLGSQIWRDRAESSFFFLKILFRLLIYVVSTPKGREIRKISYPSQIWVNSSPYKV